MIKQYIYIINIVALLLTTSVMAGDNATPTTPLPASLMGSEMYLDGGTIRFDLLDEQGSPLNIYIDGRLNSPTPGAFYLKSHPKDSDSIFIPQGSVLAAAFVDVIKQWLNANYTKEQQKQFPLESPSRLDIQAMCINDIIKQIEPDNENEKTQQAAMTTDEAARALSALSRGMPKSRAEEILAKHGLTSPMAIGSSLNWGEFYEIADGSSAVVEYSSSPMKPDSEPIVMDAHIQRDGTRVVTIALKEQ